MRSFACSAEISSQKKEMSLIRKNNFKNRAVCSIKYNRKYRKSNKIRVENILLKLE